MLYHFNISGSFEAPDQTAALARMDEMTGLVEQSDESVIAASSLTASPLPNTEKLLATSANRDSSDYRN